MNTLQELLVINYAQHPDFQFDQEPLGLDATLLAAFCDAYALVRAYGSRLDSRQFQISKFDCIEKLSSVFQELSAQTSDTNETLFLRELCGQSKRLLLQELEHLHAKPLVGSISFTEPMSRAAAIGLCKDRFYFGALSQGAVQEILAIGARDLAAFRRSAIEGRTTREALSVSTGPTIRRILPLLNREFRRQGILSAVSAYLGRRVTVTGTALELSVHQATWWVNSFNSLSRAPLTVYAHMDESIAYPKAIVYLSDVDPRSGPTSCYAGAYEALALNALQDIIGRVIANVGSGEDSPLRAYYAKEYHQSMSSENFRRHFMRLPPEVRFNSHFGWDVIPGSDLEKSMVAREQYMLGAAGTYIVFDGAHLLHRGGMLEHGERIALQVIFSSSSMARRAMRNLRRIFP
jgi:hypothetical protein